jgi:hypothetical protein
MFFQKKQPATKSAKSDLRFASTAVMERNLDGSAKQFQEYFFAIYHCLPDEKDAGIVSLRERMREQFPDKAIGVGKYFVLQGEPAFQSLRAYYYAIATQHQDEHMREYFAGRQAELETAHAASQSLPIPVDLTEGQLNSDRQLEFLTLLALDNGQVNIV